MKTSNKISRVMSCLIVCITIFMSACNNSSSKQTEKAKTVTPTETTDTTSKVKEEKSNDQTPLTLIIKNLKSPKAPVLVTFYEKKNKFLSLTDILKTYTLMPEGNTVTSKIDDLKYGEYAIASYQDINSNNKIDKNLIGIPKEPYGFSNNYKPTVRAPHYSNCKFEYSKTKNSLTISMR